MFPVIKNKCLKQTKNIDFKYARNNNKAEAIHPAVGYTRVNLLCYIPNRWVHKDLESPYIHNGWVYKIIK